MKFNSWNYAVAMRTERCSKISHLHFTPGYSNDQDRSIFSLEYLITSLSTWYVPPHTIPRFYTYFTFHILKPLLHPKMFVHTVIWRLNLSADGNDVTSLSTATLQPVSVRVQSYTYRYDFIVLVAMFITMSVFNVTFRQP